MKINTVLFDLDGTLVNTNDLILASFQHTMKHYIPEKAETFDITPYIGQPLIDIFKSIDEERADDMLQLYRKHNAENHDLLIKEYDGVYEAVKALKERGVKLGVVTNKVHHMAVRGLKVTRLHSFFDVVVGFDDVSRGKPHAEPIMKALESLNSTPESALMVGDSQFDVQAGKNAGTYTACVGWSLRGQEIIQQLKPDYVVHHMSEVVELVGVQ